MLCLELALARSFCMELALARSPCIGPCSPRSISFNDNAIVRNFYPKKFHSSKLFKDFFSTFMYNDVREFYIGTSIRLLPYATEPKRE